MGQRLDDAFLSALFTEDYDNELMQVQGLKDWVPSPAASSGALPTIKQEEELQEPAFLGSLYSEWNSDVVANAPSPAPLLSFPSLPLEDGFAGGRGSHAQDTRMEGVSADSSIAVSHLSSSTAGPSRTSTFSTTSRGSSVGRNSCSTSSGNEPAPTALARSSFSAASSWQPTAGAALSAAATCGAQAALSAVGTSTAGWQALLQKMQEAEAPVVTAQPQTGGRRGRKPNVVNGVAITKPVKDKKRENSILIKQLEQQLAEKLTLVKGLEGENTDLRRQERILQMSVDTSERNLSHLRNPDLEHNLEPMLRSFRGTYNRSTAERVLAKMANLKNGQGLTFELFAQCWQAIVMEMCDALVADATAHTQAARCEVEQHLQALQEQLVDFIMAICATDLGIIRQAKSRNLCTGEEAESYEFWEGVVEKLTLTHEQILDLIQCFDMFARLFERNLLERRQLKEQLSQAIAADAKVESPWRSEFAETREAVAEASEKLARNVRHCGVLHSMLSFISMRILTCRQCAQLCMHSAPFFPSIVHMQVVIRRTAERLGICTPSPTTQKLLTRFQQPAQVPPRSGVRQLASGPAAATQALGLTPAVA